MDGCSSKIQRLVDSVLKRCNQVLIECTTSQVDDSSAEVLLEKLTTAFTSVLSSMIAIRREISHQERIMKKEEVYVTTIEELKSLVLLQKESIASLRIKPLSFSVGVNTEDVVVDDPSAFSTSSLEDMINTQRERILALEAAEKLGKDRVLRLEEESLSMKSIISHTSAMLSAKQRQVDMLECQLSRVSRQSLERSAGIVSQWERKRLPKCIEKDSNLPSAPYLEPKGSVPSVKSVNSRELYQCERYKESNLDDYEGKSADKVDLQASNIDIISTHLKRIEDRGEHRYKEKPLDQIEDTLESGPLLEENEPLAARSSVSSTDTTDDSVPSMPSTASQSLDLSWSSAKTDEKDQEDVEDSFSLVQKYYIG